MPKSFRKLTMQLWMLWRLEFMLLFDFKRAKFLQGTPKFFQKRHVRCTAFFENVLRVLRRLADTLGYLAWHRDRRLDQMERAYLRHQTLALNQGLYLFGGFGTVFFAVKAWRSTVARLTKVIRKP